MAAGDGGSIINVSSVAAIRATPTELPYGAAKAALDVLTVGFGPGLRTKRAVNTITAGTVPSTDISKAWDLEAFQEMASHGPLGRGGEPHRIVSAALYLASGASSFTTGSVLRVDGGQQSRDR